MRLIDADALQRRICGAKCGCEYEDCGNEGDCSFAHFIFHAPTIDAVPVEQVKARVIALVKSLEVVLGCLGVSVLTREIERMKVTEPPRNE